MVVLQSINHAIMQNMPCRADNDDNDYCYGAAEFPLISRRQHASHLCVAEGRGKENRRGASFPSQMLTHAGGMHFKVLHFESARTRDRTKHTIRADSTALRATVGFAAVDDLRATVAAIRCDREIGSN